MKVINVKDATRCICACYDVVESAIVDTSRSWHDSCSRISKQCYRVSLNEDDDMLSTRQIWQEAVVGESGQKEYRFLVAEFHDFGWVFYERSTTRRAPRIILASNWLVTKAETEEMSRTQATACLSDRDAKGSSCVLATKLRVTRSIPSPSRSPWQDSRKAHPLKARDFLPPEMRNVWIPGWWLCARSTLMPHHKLLILGHRDFQGQWTDSCSEEEGEDSPPLPRDQAMVVCDNVHEPPRPEEDTE